MSCAGTLSVVGIGPGRPEHLTPAAREAIAGAEVLVGYRTYLELLGPLTLRKELVAGRMTQEIGRAREAIAHARAGRRVALISSGDAGIYGMASLALELLREAGWRRGDAPRLEIVPGVTALSACAALAGAPLGHDFCAVSLSDLLTPWPVVARRLEAAAAADFVIGLYNPASMRRQRPLADAVGILRRHRPDATPVAVVASAFRDGERVVLTDLAHLLEQEIDMGTTVIVGASSTFAFEGYLVTPRGYAGKYGLAGDDTGDPGEDRP